MADASFDVVSKVDHQEVDNAVNQAAKEISQRFDFKGVGAEVAWSGETITVSASTEERAKAALEVLRDKLVKRGVSLKAVETSEPRQSGKEYRIVVTLRNGIEAPVAKTIAATIRDRGPKGVKVAVQGDELRVTSKSRDDLQAVISLLKGEDLEVALQFVNFR